MFINSILPILFHFKALPSIPSTFPMTNAYNDTTEEIESDVGEGIVLRRRNAFGEPKTSRQNRPPRPKKLLEKREKIAMRKSKRIFRNACR